MSRVGSVVVFAGAVTVGMAAAFLDHSGCLPGSGNPCRPTGRVAHYPVSYVVEVCGREVPVSTTMTVREYRCGGETVWK